MRARAQLVADHAPDGGVRLPRLRSQAPLAMRRTHEGVTLVAAAGGPLGGDDVALDIEVRDRAHLRVGSAAATLVQPGADEAPARIAVTAHVAPDAVLRWLPEPTVVASGARLEMRTTLCCAPGATIVWREVLVLGRLDEHPGTVTSSLHVDVGDTPVLRQHTGLGPGSAPGWDGPAVAGGHRVLGSLLLLGPAGPPSAAALPSSDRTRSAVLSLEAGGVLVIALGETTLDVARLLDAVADTSAAAGTC